MVNDNKDPKVRKLSDDEYKKLKDKIIIDLKPEISPLFDRIKEVKDDLTSFKTTIKNEYDEILKRLPSPTTATQQQSDPQKVAQGMQDFAKSFGYSGNLDMASIGKELQKYGVDPNILSTFGGQQNPNQQQFNFGQGLTGIGSIDPMGQINPMQGFMMLIELFKVLATMSQPQNPQMATYMEIMFRKELDATIRERLINYANMQKLAAIGHLPKEMLEMYGQAQNQLWNPVQQNVVNPQNQQQQQQLPQSQVNTGNDPNAKPQQ